MQQQKRNIVIFVYIAIFSVIIPAIFWFVNPEKLKVEKNSVVSPKQTATDSDRSDIQQSQSEIDRRISIGEKILVAADGNPLKLAAAKAFAAGDYSSAVIGYEASLKIKRNDPEAWIYQNNAKTYTANGFLKIAVSVPIGGNLNVAQKMLRGVAQATALPDGFSCSGM